MIQDAVKRHYAALWGPPSRTAEFRRPGCQADVYKWDEERSPLGVNLYATIGASSYPLPGYDATHRVEFFIGLRPAADDVASTLAAVAVNTALTGDALGHGHTITFAQPLWEGTAMHAVMVMRPYQEVVPPLVLSSGLHVDFLKVIPLFPTELAFKKQHGMEALFQEWKRQVVVFSDPNRVASTLLQGNNHL